LQDKSLRRRHRDRFDSPVDEFTGRSISRSAQPLGLLKRSFLVRRFFHLADPVDTASVESIDSRPSEDRRSIQARAVLVTLVPSQAKVVAMVGHPTNVVDLVNSPANVVDLFESRASIVTWFRVVRVLQL